MFTIYIDDSGSAPEQTVAIASGIIFPTGRLAPFEGAWNEFLAEESINGFHSSECLARNQHSDFASWGEARVLRVFRRVRQLTLRFSTKAFCIAIYKKDYDEVMPADMRQRVGSYYTWALSSLLGLAYDWATQHSVPMEYVFDAADKHVKREIDEAMECAQEHYQRHFIGHYGFRNRKDLPALQAVDLFAWTCFQKGRHARAGQPIHQIAEENWDIYHALHSRMWCEVQSLNRQGIELWVKKVYLGAEDLRLKECKERLNDKRKPKHKNKGNTAR